MDNYHNQPIDKIVRIIFKKSADFSSQYFLIDFSLN